MVLKIPFTSLYNTPTLICIKGLYLIAVPNSAVVYDEKKEEAALRDAKFSKLALIEQAKLKEAESSELVTFVQV